MKGTHTNTQNRCVARFGLLLPFTKISHTLISKVKNIYLTFKYKQKTRFKVLRVRFVLRFIQFLDIISLAVKIKFDEKEKTSIIYSHFALFSVLIAATASYRPRRCN